MNPADLDPKYGYIQVSFVTPYFEEKELQERVTDFERNNTLRRFMFETPFTKGSQAQGAIEEQYKRRTILVSELRFVVGFLSQNFDDFVLRWVRFCVGTAPFLHVRGYMDVSHSFVVHASHTILVSELHFIAFLHQNFGRFCFQMGEIVCVCTGPFLPVHGYMRV